MKKIFIDGGSHSGESIDKFKEVFPEAEEYKIYCFEPNPKYRDVLLKRNVTLFQSAIWINDGEINFYGTDAPGRKDVGCTVTEEKNDISHKNPITVPCIDFSSWIKDTFSKDDYIILKLDIEGAEYKVLDQMISSGAIEYIDYLYAEFHHQWMSMSVEQHTILIERLKGIKKEPRFWDALKSEFLPELPTVENAAKEYVLLNEHQRRHLLGLI